MKLNIFGISLILLILNSCDEGLDLIQEGLPKPVIYSIINPRDTISYVRLTRCFVGDTSFEVLASDPGNLYFEKASVIIDINTDKGHPVKTYNLAKVLLSDKEDGAFARSPNYAYQLSEPLADYLQEGFQVRLVATVGDPGQLVTAQHIYHEAPAILKPRQGRWTMISMYGDDPVTIEWNDKFGFKKYEVEIRLAYQNHFTDHAELASVSTFFYEISRNQSIDQIVKTITHYLYPSDFYRGIGVRIPDNSDVEWRSFVSFDIILHCLSKEFCDYLETSQIAADRSGQPVSNVVGGLGLFSLAISSELTGLMLDNQSIDSLADGQYTRLLGFKKW